MKRAKAGQKSSGSIRLLPVRWGRCNYFEGKDGYRMNRIIFFSGGKASLATADYVKTKYPEDDIILYFTDTLWENEDLYRFINESSDKLQLPMLIHSSGMNPIQLMFEKKLVFNSMIGDCSKILKMRVASDFLKKGKRPVVEEWRNKQYLKNEDFVRDAVLYFGIGFEVDSITLIGRQAPGSTEQPSVAGAE
ncbi:phosphoadenosine phosphosulfate reductase family protein [Paenibacillus enshidis]|uniref:Phosphoadenosine phosphosulfate reductase family protein n=1 Tax=Paenibacillus enshidis TaxID=1458439 RepID=A0ABV5AXJ4_9BACL